jgi:hypothetical protein
VRLAERCWCWPSVVKSRVLGLLSVITGGGFGLHTHTHFFLAHFKFILNRLHLKKQDKKELLLTYICKFHPIA